MKEAIQSIYDECNKIRQGAHSPKAVRAATALALLAGAAFQECSKSRFPDEDRPELLQALRDAAKEMTE